MKKKTCGILLICTIGLLGTIEVNPNLSNKEKNLLSLKNIEALANGAGGNNNYNICYYESKVVVGKTYFNCSTCPTKIYDEKGKGTYSKCFY